MVPDSRQIELFVTVARHLSFSRAAAELNIQQPWLSAQIRRFEAQLGFDLFQRTTRQVTLTARGAALIKSASTALETLSALGSEIAGFKRGQAGILRVGAAPYSRLFSKGLAAAEAFEAANPAIKIELESDWSPSLRDDIRTGKLDVAFCIGSDDEPGLDRQLVEEHASHLYLRQDDPLAALDPIPVERLYDRSIITFPRTTNPVLHDVLFRELAAHGAKLERLVETNMEVCVQQIVRRGSIAIAFAGPIPPEGLGRIVSRRVTPEFESFKLFLVRRTGADSALVRSFWNAVLDHGAELRPENPKDRSGAPSLGVNRPAADGFV